ncbi:hypothetical protein GWK47_006888 [Chionoecetes opilio]|uniref:Uncharacterized protein n=1 Tax=Chionoecetes opilio TaxID=41210 RepID=A0A8J4Y473_CHIOP|nr:hypothetical protein GWK47_006888 [Chionoecetes opilio]
MVTVDKIRYAVPTVSCPYRLSARFSPRRGSPSANLLVSGFDRLGRLTICDDSLHLPPGGLLGRLALQNKACVLHLDDLSVWCISSILSCGTVTTAATHWLLGCRAGIGTFSQRCGTRVKLFSLVVDRRNESNRQLGAALLDQRQYYAHSPPNEHLARKPCLKPAST